MLKKWSEILLKDSSEEALYDSDKKILEARKSRGYFKQSDAFDFIELIHGWKDVVGQLLSENTIPLKIQPPFLVILTKHAIFSQELKHLEVALIKKLTDEFPQLHDKVSKIKFQVSESFFKYKKEILPEKKVNPIPHRFDPQYIAAKKKAEELFQETDDPEVKELFISLYIQGIFKD